MKKAFYLFVYMCCFSCSTSNIYSDYDHGVNFRSYKTFAWLPNPDDTYENSMFNNQIVESNVKNYSTMEMKRRGYEVDTTGPDLLVEYNMVIKRKERTVETPLYQYPYNYNWNTYPYYDPYRRYMYGSAPPPYMSGYQTEKIPYTEGTLTISVIDRKNNRLIWRGWNVEQVSDPETFEYNLRKDIVDIFKKYPLNPAE